MSSVSRNVITNQERYAKQEGVDIRPSSSALLGVSSIDRYTDLAALAADATLNTQSPFKFTIQSNQPLLAGFFTRIAVNEINMNWFQPTLTEKNNRIGISYKVGGIGAAVNYVITVAPGWYTPTTLATALQLAIRTATGNASFTVVYNSTAVPYAFVFNTTTADTFQLYRVNPTPTDVNRITLYEMLNVGGQIVGVFQTITTTGVPTMLSTPFVDIVCNQLTYNQSVKDADTGAITRDIVCRVQLVPDGYVGDPTLIGSAPLVICRQFNNPKFIKWIPNQNIGNLSFELYDSQGYLLGSAYDFLAGNWNMSLLVSEI